MMRRRLGITLAAVCVAALGALGGAFTAGGLTVSAPNGGFVGGSTEQEISGASVDSIVYSYSSDKLQITSVAISVQGLHQTKTLTARFTGGNSKTGNCSYWAADTSTHFVCAFEGQLTSGADKLTMTLS